jgi:hypothetical protein
MGIPQISGVIGGILAIIAGIVVIIKPQIIAWVLGIYLIIFGAFAVLAAVGIT